MRPRPAVLLVAAALVAEAGASIADDEAEPIQLDYSAPPGCPDRDAFEAHVRALTAKAHFEFARPGVRMFDVRIEAGAPLRGTMLVYRGDVVEGRRVVQADRCSDVGDALTLMVALAIDPQASLTPVSAGSAAPPSSIPSATSAAESASAALVPQPVPPSPAPPPHQSAVGSLPALRAPDRRERVGDLRRADVARWRAVVCGHGRADRAGPGDRHVGAGGRSGDDASERVRGLAARRTV